MRHFVLALLSAAFVARPAEAQSRIQRRPVRLRPRHRR
jgi:hypothetical protein